MQKRLLTALAGVIIIVAVFLLDNLKLVQGPLFFNIAMAIVSFLMCHELYKALEVKGFKPIKIIGYLCTLFIIPIGVVQTTTLMMICAISIPIVVFTAMATSVFSNLKYNVADVSVTLLGTVYICLMVAFLSATRALPLRSIFDFLYLMWCMVYGHICISFWKNDRKA